MNEAEAILWAARLWAGAGTAVALAFLTVGIGRVDADAARAYVFRPLLVPGILVLWPLVLWRWRMLATGADDPQARHRPRRDSHLAIAAALCVGIAAAFVVGLGARQTWPADFAPVRLEAPE